MIYLRQTRFYFRTKKVAFIQVNLNLKFFFPLSALRLKFKQSWNENAVLKSPYVKDYVTVFSKITEKTKYLFVCLFIKNLKYCMSIV